MLHNDKIKTYLESISNQIRFKQARFCITKEIENHIEDSILEYTSKGLDTNSAIDKTLQDLGNPIDIGTQFDRVYKPKPNYPTIAITIIMTFIGIFIRTLICGFNPILELYTILGLAIMIGIYFLDYTILIKRPIVVYLTYCFILFLMQIQPIAVYTLNGYGIEYYVERLTLLIPILYSAVIFSQRGKKLKGLILSGFLSIIGIFLCLCINSFANAVVLLITEFLLIVYAIYKDWFSYGRMKSVCIVFSTIVLGLLIVFLSNTSTYVIRINDYISSTLGKHNIQGLGYWSWSVNQVLMDSNFIGSGQSSDIIANESNSFIETFQIDNMLTMFIYKFGYLPFIILILGFIIFLGVIISNIKKQTSILSKFVAISCILSILISSLESILYNLGFCFCVGNMSFISIDGIYTIINYIYVGLLLSTFKTQGIALKEDFIDKKVLS